MAHHPHCGDGGGLRRDVRHPHRRGRHAGGDIAAEQLFRHGGLRDGLRAEKPLPHHRRLAGGGVRHRPHAADVPGDEPLAANVLLAAVGSKVADIDTERQRNVKRYSAEDGAMVLAGAQSVVFVPGYGLAVAQAQHILRELADILESRGTTVKYGIHPVAGRMPGHMNVLLAEADVPYEQLCDLETINPEFEQTDAVLTIGANDVINPAARTDPNSPIAGMPILDVDKAAAVMIIKRSLSPGFAGIDNDLFYDDKTMMLFGDGKQMLTGIVAAMKAM